MQHCQPDGEGLGLVLVDVGFGLALASCLGLLWRQVGFLVVVDCLYVIGDLTGPREQVAELDVALLVDEDVFWPDIAHFGVDFLEVVGRCHQRVQQVPDLGLLEVPLHPLPVLELLGENVRVVVVVDLHRA